MLYDDGKAQIWVMGTKAGCVDEEMGKEDGNGQLKWTTGKSSRPGKDL